MIFFVIGVFLYIFFTDVMYVIKKKNIKDIIGVCFVALVALTLCLMYVFGINPESPMIIMDRVLKNWHLSY